MKPPKIDDLKFSLTSKGYEQCNMHLPPPFSDLYIIVVKNDGYNYALFDCNDRFVSEPRNTKIVEHLEAWLAAVWAMRPVEDFDAYAILQAEKIRTGKSDEQLIAEYTHRAQLMQRGDVSFDLLPSP
jgi:hypothetical protein